MTGTTHSVLDELKTGKLPTLPHVLVEMLRICQDENSTFQAISKVINKDPAIVSRILALVNSSYYSRGQKISSLERALLLLGVNTLKSVVITASIQQFFSSFNPAHSTYLKALWQHSLSTAMIARNLASLTSYESPEEAYLAGLIHNIGELVLDANYPGEFLSILEASKGDPARQIELEIDTFLTNHSEIGAWLSESWHLNDFITDAIRFHHFITDDILDAHPLVKILNLAQELARPDSLDKLEVLEAADTLFALSASLTGEIVEQARREVSDIAKALGIDGQHEDEEGADNEKRIRLAEQIRNLGLLQSTNQLLSDVETLNDLSVAIRQASHMLFGFRNTLVFKTDAARQVLEEIPVAGKADDASDFKNRFRISLEAERCLASVAAKRGQILISTDQNVFEHHLPVIDQQLARIVNCPALIYVPVTCDDQLAGLLVMGARAKTHRQVGLEELLHLFASQCGQSLLRLQNLLKGTSRPDEFTEDALDAKIKEMVHEANNPLAIIRNYLEALAVKLGDKHEVKEEISVIREEIERTAQILVRLRDWHQTDSGDAQLTDINKEISSLTRLYERSIFTTRSIQCLVDLDDRLTEQRLNRNAFRQVITNLLKNAAEALSEEGTIQIQTNSHVNLNGKDYVEIIISDDGPGIPADIMKNIFSPVTSTKGKGHSGLGLSITRNLIREMNGSIRCKSSSRGTEFQIHLPTEDD